jgi:hypothetical protein
VMGCRGLNVCEYEKGGKKSRTIVRVWWCGGFECPCTYEKGGKKRRVSAW